MGAIRLLPEIDTVDPNQRWRKYGLIASLVGFAILALLLGYLTISRRASIMLYMASIPASALLVVTALSCWTNYRVKEVLTFVLVSLYATIWSFGYLEMYFVGMQVHAFALYLFLPLTVAALMNHKAIFALSIVQFILVFDATRLYVAEYFVEGFNSGAIAFYVAMVCASLSAISFIIIGLISMIRDNSDRELLAVINDKRKLANTDPLTGLANRRAFFDGVKVWWQRGIPFMLVYIDLLRFKPLNDQYGHAAGDAVLKELAARMREIRCVQCAARLGGDEFALVLDDSVKDENLARTMDDIHAALTEDIKSDHGLLSIGASIGCVQALTDVESLSMLTSAADAAMRRARFRGAGWVRFSKDIDEASLTTSAVELAFRDALMSGKICAAVQPVAAAGSREIIGYELLSRWTGNDFDVNPTPDQFVPIAEKLGLLNELLWRTLNEALSALHLNPLKLSINVSPGQIASTDFLPRLLAILNEQKVSPRAIILEVTEQVAFRNLERNVEVLRQARQLGMSIALDDFGTGYASLSIVDSLPLDKIKIDRSFVKPGEEGRRRDAILSAAIKMCHQLDLTCCVEGVETEGVARAVSALGADEIQGYLLGHPCLVKDLTRVHMIA